MDITTTLIIDRAECPNDVSAYLIGRGWHTEYSADGSTQWSHYNRGVPSEKYEWGEALAFEMFSHIVMMKDANGAAPDTSEGNSVG
jgi:hypothetical protein